jgi:hypothetical protein
LVGSLAVAKIVLSCSFVMLSEYASDCCYTKQEKIMIIIITKIIMIAFRI